MKTKSLRRVYLLFGLFLACQLQAYSQMPVIDSLPAIGSSNDKTVIDIVKDSSGGAWVLTRFRLCHIDSNLEVIENLRHFDLPNPHQVQRLKKNTFNEMFLLRVDGILKYENNVWKQVLNLSDENIKGKPNDFSFTPDGEPVLTISTFGVVHVTATGVKSYTSSDHSAFSSPNGVLIDLDGYFWVYSPNNGFVTNISGKWKTVGKPPGHSGQLFPISLYLSNAGRRLVGSFHGELFELHSDHTMTTLVSENSAVSDIKENASDIWYCTMAAGLKNLGGTYRDEIASIQSKLNRYDFISLVFMSENLIWMGTTEHGIVSIEFKGSLVSKNDDFYSTSLELYPNPALSHVILEVKSIQKYLNIKTVDLIDLNGRIIGKYEIGPEPTRMDVSFLKPGTYFYVLQTDERMIYRKFVKE